MTRWRQVNIAYPRGTREEQEQAAVTHLLPAIAAAKSAGLVSSWFFIRKQPWRVRYLLTGNEVADEALTQITQGVCWVTGIYEPEVHAFGGPESMDAAHKLWHADSHRILTHINAARGDRRELSLLLCTAMMRAAGLDFYEQGDAWAQVADLRPVRPVDLPDQETWTGFKEDVRLLLQSSAQRDQSTAHWLTAFEDAGATLNRLVEGGALTRGLRAVMAHHVIFHWNRFGLPSRSQALISHAAKEAVFGEDSHNDPASPLPRWRTSSSLPPMP